MFGYIIVMWIFKGQFSEHGSIGGWSKRIFGRIILAFPAVRYPGNMEAMAQHWLIDDLYVYERLAQRVKSWGSIG